MVWWLSKWPKLVATKWNQKHCCVRLNTYVFCYCILNLFQILIWFCFLTSNSFNFLRLNLSASNFCAASLLTANLSLSPKDQSRPEVHIFISQHGQVLRWGIVDSSYPPGWRTTPCQFFATAYSIESHLPFILEVVPHPQSEDAPCRSDRDPLSMDDDDDDDDADNNNNNNNNVLSPG
jgi:hypothetical protein